MNKKISTIKILIIIISGLVYSQLLAEQVEAEPSNLEELKAAIAELVKEKQVPAVSIAMVDKNGPVWVGAVGQANIEQNIVADENTLFRIGSTSKMFVALSVLKLIEEGKLSLSDKLSDLAPDIAFENQWESTDPIRLVHLLEHTTGWDDIHIPEYAQNDPTPSTLKQGLDFHPHSRTSRWKPGSRMSYCNAGPPVAAYIVEKITGQKFEEYVQENFFDPMGMSTATYLLSDAVKSKGATLYANGNKAQEYWHISMRPSGSINASARDMAKFVEFYINRGLINGQQLISPASLARMESVESTSAAQAGQNAGYGLNNYSSSHKNWVYRAHNGGVNGGITEFAYLPTAGVGHTIMINSGDVFAFTEISTLIRNYETRNLDAITVLNDVKVTEEHQKIEGFYYPINSRQQVSYFFDRIANAQKLWFEGDKLARKALLGGEATYYYPVSANLYKSEQTGLIEASQVNDPLVGEVVHVGTTVLKPASALLIYSQIIVVLAWVVVVVSSILFFLIWGLRKARGKIPSGASTKIRLWPLLAAVSVISFMLLIMQGTSDPFTSFGGPNLISVGIMLLTIAFALFAALGVYTSIKERRSVMNQGVYWYSTLSSLIHFIVGIYLLSFGVIGLMTWA